MTLVDNSTYLGEIFFCIDIGLLKSLLFDIVALIGVPVWKQFIMVFGVATLTHQTRLNGSGVGQVNISPSSH